ncbi:hypothetical protein LINPERHAP1_LOCUS34873 [Linum perenne]
MCLLSTITQIKRNLIRMFKFKKYRDRFSKSLVIPIVNTGKLKRRRCHKQKEQKLKSMENDTVAISNRWLQDLSRGSNPQNLEGLTMAGLTVVDSRKGFVRCRFTVSDRVTDGEGNWEVGAIATLIDDVGAAAIFSMVGHVKASLDFTVSFFSTAKSLVNFPPKSLLFSLISNLVLPKYVIFMDGSRMSD